RAARLGHLLAPTDIEANLSALANLLSEEDGFTQFRARWERPLLHVVFTAHPTFLLTPAQADAVATAATTGDDAVCTVPSDGPKITL
ncbi:hypothetical protein ABTN76_20325, partial [Acinetobacter baumannii]